MTSELAIRRDSLSLGLFVERYQFPEITTGSDANWLIATAELAVANTGAFNAKHQLSLFTTDLGAFRDQLRTLDRELSGEAILDHIEDQVRVAIRLANGRGAVTGFLREHVGATLSFDHIATDQTYVRESLQQLDALMDAFPVRGNPRG
jgi:hypothetical protein